MRAIVRNTLPADCPQPAMRAMRAMHAGGYRGARATGDDETMDLRTRLTEAKERLNNAAAACLRNEPGAAEAADAAQRDLDELRARAHASSCTQVPAAPHGSETVREPLANELRHDGQA